MEKRALVSQMEPADARRMFPCWDEPAFRAEFELSVVVPEKELAVSNMPVVREAIVKEGWKQVDFASTPPMASYLMALASGEFEHLDDDVDGIHLRVITTEGKIEQARYALEATKKILPFYNEYFGVRYPLPKLDQFSFPGFPAGGMENWGSIFYVDTAFLYDPASSSPNTQERVFAVVAHELAHQWFGDLVTMGWWDNLWLNEGFASWMGTKATDHFNPDWKIWLRAASSRERAMALDARSTTHPIQQPVRDAHQAADVFDEITYAKGQSFLRMLESDLGEDLFRQGIRRYMSEHAYGNATTADLWAALGAESHKPVAEMAADWTEQPGFPVVLSNQTSEPTPRVTYHQERFTIHQTDPKPLTWQIPLSFAPPQHQPRSVLLGAAEQSFDAPADGTPVKANVGAAGFYRVAYDLASFQKLAQIAPTLPEADRLNLLTDAWALIEAGRMPISAWLDLVSQLAPEEQSTAVWDDILRVLWFVDSVELSREKRGSGLGQTVAFETWARSILRPALARLGWGSGAEPSMLVADLRNELIVALGSWGEESVLQEARRRFEAFLTNPQSTPAELRKTILFLAGRNASSDDYTRLHDRARAADSTETKMQYYEALAACLDERLASQTLQISLTDELPPPQATRLVQNVASRSEQPALAWDFTRRNLDALLAKLTSIGADHYVPNLLRNFCDMERADELERFAKSNLPPEAGYAVAKSADEIRFKADFKTRTLPELDAWLAKQKR